MTPPGDEPVLVIGASGVDLVGRPDRPLQLGTSNPGQVRFSNGGVARNVAENLARLGMKVRLLTAVGNDDRGQRLLQQAAEAGVEIDQAKTVDGSRTGAYLALLNEQGALHLALDDMRVVESISSEYLRQRQSLFDEAQAVFIDANLTPDAIAAAALLARGANVPLAADPTSVALAGRLIPHLADLWLITPNGPEAEALTPHPVPHHDRNRALDAARHLVARGVRIAMVTMAEFGVAYATAEVSGHVPAVETEIIDPTGAGDAQTAAVLFALLNEIPLDEAVRLGASAASVTLRRLGSVAQDLSLELLYDELR